ncbi:hypothetical protein [Haliangium ochraceum]|uniref:Uncharacterized protein n=1 Tax=Haliangium ochraceum (strain DSM 14365 / JCM 11303 / SMP-2) TaxID=502025 RepID=D0LXA8_HALO1|nr:hypothetical protein [Haliangium ochraceum]ACY16150.1 hypothetical protein Hoch_3648 [Haliangium ochraceum DSM 14365]
MGTIFTGLSPDPHDALSVLAFVFCPPGVFVPAGDLEELEAVAELMAPAKAEMVRRWYEAYQARLRN